MSTYEAALDKHWETRRTAAVDTTFGRTRVLLDDDERDGGTPFVLLPGGGGNAFMWYRHVPSLRRCGRVIAVDPVGEPGGSVQSRPLAGGDDLAAWLDEVLAGLRVARAHVVGASYGGWVALQHALHRPGRTATLTLLDPGGFGRITGRFIGWVLAGGLAGFAPGPVRRRAAGWLRNATLLDDDVMRLVRLGISFRRRMPLPPPVTDAELAALAVPVQLMLGERSQMLEAQAVAERVRGLVRDVRIEVVPGAGHDLPLHSVDLVTARVIEFAGRADALP